MAFLRAEVIGEPLGALRERISPRNMGRVLRAGIKAWAGIIDQEFATRSWFMPGGGTKKWDDVKEFGVSGIKSKFGVSKATPANPTPLERSGRLRGQYRAAAAGGGAISVTSDGASAEYRINVGGYGVVHRGGSGKLLSGDIVPLAIQVTDKMRWFLGLNKGVWLKRETKEVFIVRRPHATSNPKIRGQLRYLFAQWAAGKPLPNYG